MSHSLRLRGLRSMFASVALSGVAFAAGCTAVVDGTPRDREPANPSNPTHPTDDAGGGGDASGGGDEDATVAEDAGADATTGEDACADGGCAKPAGCAAHAEAAFCDDFDNPDALTPNKTKWDFVEPSAQPVATLSSLRAVSAPSSLLSQVIDRDTPGAKFAKTITKAGFTEVTWEYDVYFDSVGSGDGFFLDDFQFTDAAGPDSFGFRLVMFAELGAIKELKVEHNQQATGGNYVIEPPLAAGAVAIGQWHHFKQTVKLAFGVADPGAGDGGTRNVATYALWIDAGDKPAFEKEYPGMTREQAAFARIAGMPLVFNKERSAGLKIHWDNHVLELK